MEGDLTEDGFELVRETLAADWPSFVLLPVRERRAGELAARRALRGFDAIHLAAALDLVDLVGAASVIFSSFDGKLVGAAGAEGLSSLSP